jgi:hypothetical protein
MPVPPHCVHLLFVFSRAAWYAATHAAADALRIDAAAVNPCLSVDVDPASASVTPTLAFAHGTPSDGLRFTLWLPWKQAVCRAVHQLHPQKWIQALATRAMEQTPSPTWEPTLTGARVHATSVAATAGTCVIMTLDSAASVSAAGAHINIQAREARTCTADRDLNSTGICTVVNV